MIETPEVVLERVEAEIGRGESLRELSRRCALRFRGEPVGGVITATFSNERRFPSLAVEIASALGLPAETPAFDLQLACSAYPYAVYLAGRLAADSGRKVLVIDGDVQSRLVDASDHATGAIFSDAVTATLVSSDRDSAAKSRWDFLSRYDEALECGETGPIRMEGMKVFTFVATEVSKWLRGFIAGADGQDFRFCPHQANPYMIRQLAKSLGLADRLLTLSETVKNPGSCSVPLTLWENRSDLFSGTASSRVLIAGFGAGYSASAGLVCCKGA